MSNATFSDDLASRASKHMTMVVGICAALLTLVAFGVTSLRGVAGVAAGGLLATSNIFAFAWLIRRATAGTIRMGQFAVLSVLKFLFVTVIGWLVFARLGLTSGAVAAGYGALPLGLVLGAIGLRPEPGTSEAAAPSSEDQHGE